MHQNLRRLELPYIGMKIESIPTMLKVLESANSSDDFIKYYEKLGKTKKTADEYLRSLRNIQLATLDKNNNTKISKFGLDIVNDDIALFYNNLLKHCLKKFPDLKIVKDLIVDNEIKKLAILKKILKKNNLYIQREQTLSSYSKLIIDLEINQSKLPTIKSGDRLELNQLEKIILSLVKNKANNFIEPKELISYLLQKTKNKIVLEKKILIEYLFILDRTSFLKLYYANPNTVSDKRDFLETKNGICYKIEVLYDK